VRLLCVDVDGVLTDAGMYYGPDGEVLKKFNTRDGMGLARVREAGVAVAMISGEDSAIVHARAAKLKIDDIFCNASNKRQAIDDLCRKHGLEREQVAFAEGTAEAGQVHEATSFVGARVALHTPQAAEASCTTANAA